MRKYAVKTSTRSTRSKWRKKIRRRRIKRDIAERGRDVDGILQQYARFVKPAFDDFVFPTKKFADVIIPRGLDNIVAIDLITRHVQLQLDERGYGIRKKLQLANSSEKLPIGVFKVGEGMDSVVDDYLKGLEIESTGKEIINPTVQESGKILSNVVLQQIINDYPSSLVGITILSGGSVVGDSMSELKSIPRGFLEIEIKLEKETKMSCDLER